MRGQWRRIWSGAYMYSYICIVREVGGRGAHESSWRAMGAGVAEGNVGCARVAREKGSRPLGEGGVYSMSNVLLLPPCVLCAVYKDALPYIHIRHGSLSFSPSPRHLTIPLHHRCRHPKADAGAGGKARQLFCPQMHVRFAHNSPRCRCIFTRSSIAIVLWKIKQKNPVGADRLLFRARRGATGPKSNIIIIITRVYDII